jgi:hypothetical protein
MKMNNCAIKIDQRTRKSRCKKVVSTAIFRIDRYFFVICTRGELIEAFVFRPPEDSGWARPILWLRSGVSEEEFRDLFDQTIYFHR